MHVITQLKAEQKAEQKGPLKALFRVKYNGHLLQ